jgi:hypothetical protein
VGRVPVGFQIVMVKSSLLRNYALSHNHLWDVSENEENLIRRAGIYALSGWLDDHGRMTDKISCTESH